jgi:hypothetical protein
MFSAVKFLAILLLSTACGAEGHRYSTGENAGTNNTREETHGTSTAFHSGDGWAQGLTFYVAPETPEDVVQGIVNAAQTWNEAVGWEVIHFDGEKNIPRGAELYSSLADDYVIIYYESLWSATTGKKPTVIATTVWENFADNSAAIAKGDIILNAEDYWFGDTEVDIEDGSSEQTLVDTETVMLHEFGHLLGLNHLDDEDSVMQPYTPVGEGQHSRILGDVDTQNIREIY